MSDPFDFLWNLLRIRLFPPSTQKIGARIMTAKRTTSEVDQQIDENLKRVYDDVLNEAVPDRFHDLIAQLKDADMARQSERKDSNDD
jgi:hypothetical protein